MTQEALQERIDAYSRRYKVSTRGPMGLPPYPAGERETPQHRDWMVLYKAISRFRRRQAALPSSPERIAALERQDGKCPICLAAVGAEGQAACQPHAGSALTIVHPECDELLGLVLKLGPPALDRVRAYAWPASGPSKAGKTR
jgi:hypothetical protein